MIDFHKPDFILRLLIRIVSIAFSVPLGIVAQGLKTYRRPYTGRDRWVETTSTDIFLKRLDPAFDGYRIVHLSDFHMGTWLTRDLLCEAVDLVNQLEPDLVAITGDFVTADPQRYARDLIEPLSQLNPKDGAFAILGNHDHWSDQSIVRRILHFAKVNDLSNHVHKLSRGSAELFLAGIDNYTCQKDKIQPLTTLIPPGRTCILLAHEPDYADISALSGLFDLQLSGHSHGGQIRLPLIGAPVLPKHARKYPMGYYQIKDMKLYTNRGLGMAELSIRWNCPPEITLITLRSPKSKHPDSLRNREVEI
jgi:predicted MPP superfamily phosphohydrolase